MPPATPGRFLSGPILLLVAVIGSSASGQSVVPDPLQDISALAEAGEHARALDLLRPLLAAAPDDYRLQCLIADLLSEQAEGVADTPSAAAGKEPVGEAVDHARRATELEPKEADGWFQLGRALGVLSQLPGGGETVAYARESRAAFERALELDPDHIGALHGLACWHREVADLPGLVRFAARVLYGGLPPASCEEAIRLFQRAIELDPNTIRHHLELGKTYLVMKERPSARREFETVLRLPEQGRRVAVWKEEAAGLLLRTGRGTRPAGSGRPPGAGR
jgi:tetratricopeptide (TPR) repeat protein